MAFQKVLSTEQIEQSKKLVGTSLQRIDSNSKVKGEVVYTRDMQLIGMLYAKIKRCHLPHARITKLDFGSARRIGGVKAFLSGRDFPKTKGASTPALALEEVLYADQGVAAVAAIDRKVCEEAVEAIEVEYQEMPAVFESESSVSEQFGATMSDAGGTIERGDVRGHFKVRKGDADRAFGSALRIVENDYSTAIETHFQMEPLTFLARPDYDGGVTLWCTSSGAHRIQFSLSEYLQLDPHLIRVNIPMVGGWFGQREEAHMAAVCCALALRAHRPVKLELSREETIATTGVRHPSKIHVKDGITTEGKIIAREIRAVYDGGAYGSSSLLRNSILAAVSVYDIPNLKIDSYRIFSNRVPGVSTRAPMGPQMAWAIESHMDYVAFSIGMDPVLFRLRNLLLPGMENGIGETLTDISHERCLLEVVRSIGVKERERAGSVDWSKTEYDDPDLRLKKDSNEESGEWRRGRGVAVTAKWAHMGIPVQATVRIRESGKVEVSAEVIEVGQGTQTSLTQIVADEFGIPASDVIMMPFVNGADSSVSGFATGASGSRQLVNLGNAVLIAAREAKHKVAESASAKLGAPPEKIEVDSGRAFDKRDPNNSIKISDLFTPFNYTSSKALFSENEFEGHGTVFKKPGRTDPQTGQSLGGPVESYYSSAAQACEISVNVETGQVRIERIAAALDVGRAINPELVKCQIIGSVAMGLSAALSEELQVVDGRIANANLADYKIVTSVDAPRIQPIIIETPHDEGPLGAKSAGEASILPTAPCIRNAIHDAVGVWINDLPITPTRILLAIFRKENSWQY